MAFCARSTTRVALACCLCIVAGLARAASYEIPKNLEQGWDAQVQFGALATFGVNDTSAISARTDLSYRGERFEHELVAKFYRSSSVAQVTRLDASGKQVVNSKGEPVTDRVKTTTSDRRFLSVQPRWFFTSRHYLFALADVDINEPDGVSSSTLHVGGVGYKLWKSRGHYASAAVGVGRRRFEPLSGEVEAESVGYVGLRFKRLLSETVSLSLMLDSDFGGEESYSEAEASLSWRVRGPVAIKFKYGASVNSRVVNPWNTFDDGVEAAMSVNLEVEVF